MDNENKKKANDFWERFQFVLSVNDNIVCQRYFKILGFNPECIGSLELKECMDECVTLIKRDLESKSRTYLWYTVDSPVKLCGFENPEETEYLTYEGIEPYVPEQLNPYDVSFKFTFLIDDEKIYEYLWDGTQYPKFIRNTVDLQNSNTLYKDSDQSSLNFSQSLSKRLTYGKPDYTYVIIKNIIHTATRRNSDYTHSDQYGDKKIMLTKGGVPFNKTMIHNFWQNKGEKGSKKI